MLSVLDTQDKNSMMRMVLLVVALPVALLVLISIIIVPSHSLRTSCELS